MKRSLLCAALVLSAFTAFGASMPAGTHEFRIDLMSDFQSNPGYKSLPVSGGVGYFFADNLEGGLYVSWRQTQWDSFWGKDSTLGVGLFGEYDFGSDSILHPFVTARAGALGGHEHDDKVAQLAGGGGARVFLTETFSLSATVELEWSNKDIYNFKRVSLTEGEGDKTDVFASVGARLLF